MVLKLVKPDKKYLPSVIDAVTEYRSAPAIFTIHAVDKMIAAADNNFAEYFIDTEKDSLGIDLKPNYVAHTVFWLIDNDKYIGTFDLRHKLTPDLEKIGGHIAYQIRPAEQRKGYAYEGLKLCMKKAQFLGLNEVLLTCKADNIASYGVMHKAIQQTGGKEIEPFIKDNVINRRVWLYCKN